MNAHKRVSLQWVLLTLFTALTLIAGSLVAAPQASAAPVEAGSEIGKNPPLPEKCGGLSMALVFDVSGSIKDEGLAQSKEAGKAVVEALEDTRTDIGIYSFASTAPAKGLTNLDKTPSSEQQKLKDHIDTLAIPKTNRDTNWEKGLGQVKGKGYSVVYLITDGEPNKHGDAEGGKTDSVQAAVKAANELKAEGTRVVPLAVGKAVEPGTDASTYLKYISGPDDAVAVTEYTELSNRLVDQATKGCQGEIHIEKNFVDKKGNPVEPTEPTTKDGWKFSIENPVSNDPKKTIAAFDEEFITDEDGKVTLRYRTSRPGTEGTVTVAEANGQLKGVTCTDAEGAEIEVSPEENKFTVPAKTGAELSCQVSNLDENIPGPLDKASSAPISERCLPAVGGLLGVLLLALPLMAMKNVKIPGLEGLQGNLGQQIQQANNQLQRNLGIYNEQAVQFTAQLNNQLKAFGANSQDVLAVLGGLAALAGLGGYLAAFCAPGTGSSGEQTTIGEVFAGSSKAPEEQGSEEEQPGEEQPGGSSEEE